MPLNHAPQQSGALLPAFDDQEARFARAFAVIRDGIAQRAFPGAALAVTHGGALVALQGFGAFTYDEGARRIESGTVFDLASVTKALVTTTVAMLLMERGQLVLEQPIDSILPEFISLAPAHERRRRRAVTVRMLLAHSSGLPAYEKLFEFASTRHDLIRAAMTTRLIADPGERAEYSDIGFILLGELLERIAGTSLDQFAQEEVFVPLGMAVREVPPSSAGAPANPSHRG